MNIPNCGTECPLQKMYEIYDHVLPKFDYKIECELYENLVMNGEKSLESTSTASVNGYLGYIGYMVITKFIYLKHITIAGNCRQM